MPQPGATYGLIGYSLGHSFSQSYFTEKFESEGIDARYLNFELPDIGDLMELISELPGLAGLNVTIPYKEQILPYLDHIDPRARDIGAVNVVKVDQTDGRLTLTGYNSDIVGFGESIRPLLRPGQRHALILGTGGSSRAVEYALSRLGIRSVKVSRTPAEGQLGYDALTHDIIRTHEIIVNTTPLGMYPDVDSAPDIPYDALTPAHLCYDLLYNPDVTLFMRLAAEHGAVTKNGLEMLLLQADESWRIWTSDNT